MKKGFMFYLGFLLLLVFGAALVMLVILMFSPGTELLGFKYFSNSQTISHETTSDDSKTVLNLGEAGKYSEIQIEAGYANVAVQNTNEYGKHSITIVNNSKGFVMAKDAVDFKYSILVEGSVLKVSVTEPTGFLFFSRDVQVIVHIANRDANPFTSTKFKITTDSGNIRIGSPEGKPYSYDLDVGAIDLKTNSGEISLQTTTNYDKDSQIQTFSTASLNIGSGKFTSSVNTFKTMGNMYLQSTSGRFTMPYAVAEGNIYIKTESSTYEMKKMRADGVFIETQNGYFNIEEIDSSVKFPSADMNVDSTHLVSKKITGDLTVVSGNNMNINVQNVMGNTNISTTSGSVTIGDGKDTGVYGAAAIKTQSGKIKVYICDGNDKIKDFTTDNAEIELYLLGQAKTIVTTNTKSGTSKINMQAGASYQIAFTYMTKTEEFDLSKVKFKDYPNVQLANPFFYGETTVGKIVINTDSNVELALFTA